MNALSYDVSIDEKGISPARISLEDSKSMTLQKQTEIDHWPLAPCPVAHPSLSPFLGKVPLELTCQRQAGTQKLQTRGQVEKSSMALKGISPTQALLIPQYCGC